MSWYYRKGGLPDEVATGSQAWAVSQKADDEVLEAIADLVSTFLGQVEHQPQPVVMVETSGHVDTNGGNLTLKIEIWPRG